jgi:hypothetical protein
MKATSELMIEAEALEPGESKRITCVFCNGNGRTMSLSRTPEGTVVWNCFRASCEAKGAQGGGRLVRTRHKPREQKVRPYTGELASLDDSQMEFLLDKIGWTDQHVAMARPRWAPEAGRFAFPIFGPMGVRRGYVLRSYDEFAEVKALTRMDLAEPHMSWYCYHGDPNHVVVVEDIPSAVRAGMYAHAVALCGTGAGPDYINEIAAHARNITWALDADATSLAVKWHRKHSLLFDSSRVLPLEYDIKDMDEADVAALLEGD